MTYKLLQLGHDVQNRRCAVGRSTTGSWVELSCVAINGALQPVWRTMHKAKLRATVRAVSVFVHHRYRAFADRRGYLIEFITDNNLAYVKPAVIREKQHYACSENTLYGTCTLPSHRKDISINREQSNLWPKDLILCASILDRRRLWEVRLTGATKNVRFESIMIRNCSRTNQQVGVATYLDWRQIDIVPVLGDDVNLLCGLRIHVAKSCSAGGLASQPAAAIADQSVAACCIERSLAHPACNRASARYHGAGRTACVSDRYASSTSSSC